MICQIYILKYSEIWLMYDTRLRIPLSIQLWIWWVWYLFIIWCRDFIRLAAHDSTAVIPLMTLTATGQASSGKRGLSSISIQSRGQGIRMWEREREASRVASVGSATRTDASPSGRVKPRTPHAASQSQHRARAVNASYTRTYIHAIRTWLPLRCVVVVARYRHDRIEHDCTL